MDRITGGLGRGDNSVGVIEWPSEGGSSSSTGKEGSDLSNESIGDAVVLPIGVFCALLRFLLRAIRVS